ncbi:hypothetical protein K450DRAFT_247987 [Umbelopsis ramanniana AG]|uniref:HMG box domain-containing protein n=1 Tax=Umbelopsis ramanniana AG TaxID=1314678 RepID=A0AAD5E9S0_UMBRA|nr:uncharacterized protein K450DRAFT_247987 [Umbelopsis ramanniana AG]KAI8578260.1 hypothetical protein K450DRAFT_247987 [Umbelopsis ramanniana AG]
MENSSDQAASELELKEFLRNCGLGQYTDALIAEGFDQLKSLFEIIESDLEALDVKRGHRRLLQRAIANAKGYDPNLPLPTTNNASSRSSATSSTDSPNYNPNGRHLPPVATSPVDIRADTVSSTEEDNFSEFARSKRKYRRHAKADKNAPIKPPSAYVMFSNQVRSELKDYNMSFTDLAKIVGDRWKSISSEEKDQYDRTALKAKEEYLEALSKYEQTDEHKDYQRYLADFKVKQQAAARAVGKPRKRPKMASPSSGSIADASNNSNGNNGDTSSSSNGNSIANSNEHATPILQPSSSRSDIASSTTDSGIFSNSSNFEPYGNSEAVSSSSGPTSVSSGDTRSMGSNGWYKQGRYHHHPHKLSQSGHHRPPIQSGESSESRSTSDHSQFTGSSTSNSYSPSTPYDSLPLTSNVRPPFKDPSKFDRSDMLETSKPGMMQRSSPAMYQRQSNRRSDSIPNPSRLPPLHTPVSTAVERDGDGGPSPAL